MTSKRPHRRRPARLTRRRRLGVYVIGLGVWLSGTLWLLFHYFAVQTGPFGPEPHPLESWWLKLHGAFAFATLWIFGLLWGVHLVKGWSAGQRRWSGGLLVGALLWFVISGYLLYYVGDDDVRAVLSVLHWASGLAAPALFLVHRFQRSPSVATAATGKPQLVLVRRKEAGNAGSSD